MKKYLTYDLMAFIIKGKINSKWVTLDQVTAIGHKYLKKLTPAIMVKEMRLRIINSKEIPEIINFSI